MSTGETFKPRPYWHVDAKWVTAILLLFLLSATYFMFILAQVTGEEQGIDLLTVMLASSFSREGLDQEADLEIMRQKIAESPNGEWQPIPSLNIVVHEEDIAGLSPREMRLWFFRQLAEPIYYEGQKGLESLATDPEMRENMQGGLGPLGFISAETHARLNRVLITLGVVSLALLGLLVFFSYRFGRLGSPGCVIFLSAVPGVVAFSMLRGWIENAGQNPSPATATDGISVYAQLASRLAADALPGIAQLGLRTYLTLILIGFGLMLAALIGMVFKLRKREKPSSSLNQESDTSM